MGDKNLITVKLSQLLVKKILQYNIIDIIISHIMDNLLQLLLYWKMYVVLQSRRYTMYAQSISLLTL